MKPGLTIEEKEALYTKLMADVMEAYDIKDVTVTQPANFDIVFSDTTAQNILTVTLDLRGSIRR